MPTEKQRRLKAERDAYENLLSCIRDFNIRTPKRGWIKAIREMLGMSVSQLGSRANLDSTTITRLEANEAKGVITLKSLNKLAESLECDLVYALVPKKRFVDILGNRAEAIINREAKKAEHSMALEDQGGGELSDRKRAIQRAILAESFDRKLWEDK